MPYVSIKLPRISINEHGKRGAIINAQHEIRSMDLSKDTCSIFLSEENREKPGKQLAEILSKKENSHVLSGLLGTNAKANIEEECNKLLSDNLFVPMYLQHNDGAIINFINVVTNSKFSRQYKSTIFFVNKEGVNVNYLEWAASNGLLSKEIGKIIIKTQGGEREILHRNAYSNAKKIKLLVGYRIDDDHDYKNIFHCAQYFAGCSGDKTLESVLSNGLIPLFIPHNDSKISFIENASQVSELFKFLVVLDAASNSYDNAIEPCVPGTKGEYDDLFDDDEPLSQEDLAELKKDAQNYLQNLGKDFDQNFFEDWKKMCIDLRVNYNLHDKLPEIIDGFFRKNGLEVTENKGEKKEILTNYEKHIRDQKDNNNSENAPKTLGIHKTQF